MVQFSAPLAQCPLPPYPASLAVAAAAAAVFAAIQLLCWRSKMALWLRLAPLGLALCLGLASLLCVINLVAPYEMGFVLFCALACLAGSLSGLALGSRWKKK